MAVILIVDDRPTNRELLVTLLGYAGHRVLEAAEGETGLAIARANHPDLIITDIVMPTMDGYEFARQVRADPAIRETQIIFYTSSYVVTETRRLAEACGVSIVISKPIEPQELLDTVQTALNGKYNPVIPPASEEFHREHMRLLTDTLAKKVDELEAEIVERTKAQEALAASHKRFQSLIEYAPDGIALLGMDGRLRQVTPSTEQILGYTVEEAQNQDPSLLTHPDDLPILLGQLNDLIQNPGKVIVREYRFKHKDGSWRWLESIVSNLLAEPGVEAIVFNYRDITQRKQSEEALRESETRYRLATQATNDVIWEWTLKSKQLTWSENARHVLGYSSEEINDQTWWDDHIHPEDRQHVTSKMDEVMAGTDTIWSSEYRFLLKDGSYAYISDHGYVERDTDGTAIRMIGAMSNITERKQAEIALQVSEEQYRRLFEDSPISLWVEDFSEIKQRLDRLRESGVEDIPTYLREHPDFVTDCANQVRVMDVNSTAIQLYHARDKAELLGRLMDVLPKISVEQFERELIALASGQLNFERDGVEETLTGEQIYVHTQWTVAPGYEDTLARVLVSTVDITERKQAEERAQLQIQRLRSLHAIDVAISSSFNLNLTLDILLNQVITQLHVDAAAVLLFQSAPRTLIYGAGRGFNTQNIRTAQVKLGEGYAGKAVLERRTIHVSNLMEYVDELPVNFVLMLNEEKFVDYYCLPLIVKGAVKGVLEIFHRSVLKRDSEWLDFLETLAGQAAIAIEDSTLFENLQHSNQELFQAYDATIEGWSHALDLRDKETEGHTQRVTELTVELARLFGFTEEQLITIRWGALLHDIGKMGVPDNILLKPDKLTEEEWTIMRKHPTFAFEMLSPIAYLKSSIDIPYCHHEKWDGTGYPRGLKGEVIPLAARLFAVVDVWDALRSDRPYRKAWSIEMTRQHIRSLSGTHFDPKAVENFLNMVGHAID